MSEQLIFESRASRIFLVDDSGQSTPVIKKVLNLEFPTHSDLAAFYNEYEILEGLHLKGGRNALKRTFEGNQHCLYLEWFEGNTLADTFRQGRISLADFLSTAIASAEALGEIHQHNIIHKDINPRNILINTKTQKLKIIDFGISTIFDLKDQYLRNPETFEGSLAYFSPEQTGRINRTIDYRTDLYSFGVTLYEILAGRPPFSSTGAMELVHAHIAQVPDPVHKVNPSVPPVLGNIIAKLMAKNAEDRYQSAFGLKHDLEVCLDHYTKTGDIPDFPLAQQDYSHKFHIPQKLYGREKEILQLQESFERCADGGLELVLVSGYSGTGKTSLIHEIHKPVTQKQGYFIEGKFDQFQRTVPYFAFLQAFGELLNFLLTDNEHQLALYRFDIQSAVGSEGKVLTDVLPNLELVIGKQPDVPEVGASEAQNRFNYVFRKFVSAITKPEHPVVLFIDDLQWADSASLGLLKLLMNDAGGGHLLCICAFRDNEMNDAHPFMITVNDLRKNNVAISSIHLENLARETVNELIADVVGEPREVTRPLSDLVYLKTQGNAFFVAQFLKSLYEEQLLVKDFENRKWRWDIKKVEAQNITSNVVDLMAGKILKLPEQTRQALQLAACIGYSFNLDTLALIYGKSSPDTLIDLRSALFEGLLSPSGDQMKFSHDRIQQAVYSLIPDNEKNAVHLRIGRLLLNHLPENELEDSLIDVVAQLNHGADLMDSEDEKNQLAQLNFRAGFKAKQSYAFKSALELFETGIGLLKPDHWNVQYDLSKNLYTQAADAAYLSSDFNTMESFLSQVIAPHRPLLDQVAAFEIRIKALIAQNRLKEALFVGLDILNKLGVRFPAKPTQLNVIGGLLNTKVKLLGKSFEELENLPQLQDEMQLARMRLCAEITPPAYWVDPNILLLAVFKIVRISVTDGASLQSIYAFGTYGMVMCELGDIPLGKKFGDLTYKLLENPATRSIGCRSRFLVLCFIHHWSEPLRESIEPFLQNYQLGLETGSLDFAALSYYFYCQHGFYSGVNLAMLSGEMKTATAALDDINQSTPNNYLKIHYQSVLNFTEPNERPWELAGPVYDTAVMLPKHQEENDKTGMYKCHFNQMLLGYFFGNQTFAHDNAQKAYKLLDGVTAQHVKALYFYYDSLICLALCDEGNKGDTGRLLGRVKKNQRKLKTWAKYASHNFSPKFQLVEAERLRVLGKNEDARIWYDKAIEGAIAYQFTHEKALAFELAGRFYLNRNSTNLASYYLTSAYHSYSEWGAKNKLQQLERQYKKYLYDVNKFEGTTTTLIVSNRGITNRHAQLDIDTILKASTIISGEIELSKLLAKLMSVSMENAGAQSGILMLEQDGNLFVEVRANINKANPTVLDHIDVNGCGLLSEMVVKYVKRTKESVVVKNAATDVRFEKCPYIRANGVKSILCLPIINHGRLIGILYLENNATTDAFLQDRVELLTLLSGQIAVSIENALLYDKMEQRVRDRTSELMVEKKKSDDLLYNILPAETAEELKREGKTKPRKYDSVTVMFTDFVGFTKHAEELTPDELVSHIDAFFGAFDNIIEKYGIEKIKTIGDAYMCVGGLPVPNSTHPEEVAQAAKEILAWVERYKQESIAVGKKYFDIRIGLHTGSVVAGVVGSKKFAYDIWGDAVNTASRMESSCEPGKINISGDTYLRIKERFSCTYRGKISVKNKGEIDMYFLD